MNFGFKALSASPIKILIVDDSRIYRKQIERALEDFPEYEVVGSVWNGKKAMEILDEVQPDIISLDLEMPEMDGLETLDALDIHFSDSNQTPGVVMLSSHTQAGADNTLEALRRGAFDFITKPDGGSPGDNFLELQESIHTTFQAWIHRDLHQPDQKVESSTSIPVHFEQQGTLPMMIGIGISTGGPKALMEFLPGLCSQSHLPICIVQHMPESFTRSLAQSLDRSCCYTVKEADNGESLQADTVYLAPGGQHLVLEGTMAECKIRLSQAPPENGFRPSADVLFRSMAKVFENRCLALIMTGMGKDGTAGLIELKEKGGGVLAQDRSSSVVWGMPGSAIEAGVVDEVAPLNRLAEKAISYIGASV